MLTCSFVADTGGAMSDSLVKLVMMAPLQAAMILFSSFLLSHRLLLLLRFWLPPISIGMMLEEDDAVEEEVEASTGSATAE